MSTATEQLLKDHRMIRKILENLQPEDPRFSEVLKTLERVVLAHAWFEDVFLMPVINRSLLYRPFWLEIAREHEDIAGLLTLLRKTDPQNKTLVTSHRRTLFSLLGTHFAKEEDVLFPLAEETIPRDALVAMAADMERRKGEVRPVIEG